MSCHQTRTARNAADEGTHTNPGACFKTNESDDACLITRQCEGEVLSCPLIQSQSGVVMCAIDDKTNFISTVCYRSCHKKDEKSLDPQCLNVINGEARRRLGELDYFLFEIRSIDKYKKFVGPLNLTSNSGCEALNVPASVCDDFMKYRVLLCGGSVWQQVLCYLGNCKTDTWPIETTLGCRYAVVPDGVALCPSPAYSQFHCRFMCIKKDSCSKERYKNTNSGRQRMFSAHNFKEEDWKSLEEF